ncbi:MAG: cell division protein FtsQ/DivIB [Bacteroidia bacterium]
MKRILSIALWLVLALGAILITSFAVKQHNERICQKVNITITRQPGAADQLFITTEDVHRLMNQSGDNPIGKPVSAISVPALENWLNSLPAVQNADAFMSVDCQLNISIAQRRPICRVITSTNESYYIDNQGMVMPWMAEFTAAVTPVTGFISESYGRLQGKELNKIAADSAVKSPILADDIWHLCKVIDNDTLLRSQIAQIYIRQDCTFELIPRVGAHRIILGNIAGLDEKFAKLRVFYQEGLRHTGSWNKYSTIDLQYHHQIVCTKKPETNGI